MPSLRLAPLLMGNHVGTHGRGGFVWSRIPSPSVGENSYLLPRRGRTPRLPGSVHGRVLNDRMVLDVGSRLPQRRRKLRANLEVVVPAKVHSPVDDFSVPTLRG